jgi:hypothetical protein
MLFGLCIIGVQDGDASAGGPRSGCNAYKCLTKAMPFYEEAERLRPKQTMAPEIMLE